MKNYAATTERGRSGGQHNLERGRSEGREILVGFGLKIAGVLLGLSYFL